MDDCACIREMYREYWRCMIAKDADGLRRMLAEDYYLVHMTGVKQSADHDTIDVTIKADKAYMVAKSRVLAAVYGGRKNCWRLQGDFTMRKEGENWKFTSSKALTY